MNQQNAQNTYQSMNYENINPKNFDPKIKNQIVNQNIYHSGYGNYKVCPVTGSIKFPYKSAYNPGTLDTICKVMVRHKYAIDVADSLVDHGLNSLSGTKIVPVVMYPMGHEFTGTNFESREGIYDENIILRSNYPYIVKKQPELFQIKNGQKTVVYSNPITIIRDSNYNPLHYDKVFKISVVTLCFEKQEEHLTEIISTVKPKDKNTKERKILSSVDMLTIQMYLENVFQVAICGYHDVILLPIFSKEFGIPIEDQILVYNLCIMKFGHMFKAIIICVPPHENIELFEYMDKEIIKPQEITKEIDMKYVAENMAKRINKKSDISTTLEQKKDMQKKDMQIKMASMDDDAKLKLIKGMIKKNKKNANRQSV